MFVQKRLLPSCIEGVWYRYWCCSSSAGVDVLGRSMPFFGVGARGFYAMVCIGGRRVGTLMALSNRRCDKKNVVDVVIANVIANITFLKLF